ncbi:hypothetical protein [Caulobacter segnis]|uniref:hypothetical protein n=1 Tax=Caulobacter segnis TaxID=88688 RepID=UPI00285D1BAE|nr:hypothetical protein [Caulobacter segnis]MDR6624841.1 hypothetical protein [Caulobacter segnis]
MSRVFDDGTLVELLYDPDARTTAFAVRAADGTLRVEETVVAAEGLLTPYSPTNNLLTSGCVLLPSAIGDEVEKGDLLSTIRAYLGRYVSLSPTFAEIAAHYVLLTWVYDAFNELPYLRVQGTPGSGKTRFLLVLGAICYKPFFASGASTVSPIFHILDGFQGTLILDEADFRFSDTTAELTKVLNNGNVRGLPVLRTMANRHRELNPTAFRVFGPKIVGMRGPFADDALETRFITETMGGRPLDPIIPIHLPHIYRAEAQELRNLLLTYRLRHWGDVAPDPARLIEGVSARTNQTALALLSVIDDAEMRSEVAARLADTAPRAIAPRASLDALMIEAVAETFATGSGAHAAVRDIADRFNAKTIERFATPMTNKWIGAYLRTRFGLATTKTRGLYVVPATERERVNTIAAGHPSQAMR